MIEVSPLQPRFFLSTHIPSANVFQGRKRERGREGERGREREREWENTKETVEMRV